MNARTFLRLCGVFLLALLLLTACKDSNSNAVTVDKGDAGSTVTLTTGQELLVQLESNVTTGYSWAVAEGNEDILPQQGDPEYVTSQKDRKLIGAGGVEIFHFKPVKTGQVHLKLIYRRPWEKDTPPVETYEIDVNVQ